MPPELSAQQQAVVRHASPPDVARAPVVVISTAGSGKTTALVAIAAALAAAEHTKIAYCVFNKEAQQDARASLGGLPDVAKTLHAHVYARVTKAVCCVHGGEEV